MVVHLLSAKMVACLWNDTMIVRRFTKVGGWNQQQFSNSTLQDLRILFSQAGPKN
jgi:hypothetical protein